LNILITGGAGFIGSNLAEILVEDGHELYILDVKEHPVNLSNVIHDVTYIKSDIRNGNVIADTIKKNRIDGIVHLAAVSRVVWGEKNPELCKSVNINGTKTLLESVENANRPLWIIFGSSREVYGEPEKLPVKEHDPKKPINVYGYTKLVGEKLIKRYSEKIGLNCIILRFSNVYGNEKDILDRVIPKFILSALKGNKIEIHGGRQIFDFTYITDTVNAIRNAIGVLENVDSNSGFCDDFHVLPGIPTPLPKVVDIISEYLDKELNVVYTEPRKYDVEKFYGDPSKAKELLNFEAKINVEVGIPKTIDRFREVFDL